MMKPRVFVLQFSKSDIERNHFCSKVQAEDKKDSKGTASKVLSAIGDSRAESC